MELDVPQDIQTIKDMYRISLRTNGNDLAASRSYPMGCTGIHVVNAAGIAGLPGDFVIRNRQIAAKAPQTRSLFAASKVPATETDVEDVSDALETTIVDMALARSTLTNNLRDTIRDETGKQKSLTGCTEANYRLSMQPAAARRVPRRSQAPRVAT
jgi:hypothetical protein